ncbi:MAG: hypothetical protein WBD36_11405 [Bacteroidota bacterium]
MKRVFLFLLVVMSVQAQEHPVQGRITFFSSGTVYVSVGRSAGVADSVKLFVVSQGDTVALLNVMAVSSKNAACAILWSRRDLVVGDQVTGLVQDQPPPKTISIAAPPRDTLSDAGSPAVRVRSSQPEDSEKPFMTFRGRLGLQNFSSRFPNADYNVNQPGMVFSIHGAADEIPITIDMYGNLRMFARGSVSPFSSAASNESRIYRMSVEYDDRFNVVTLGRILPLYAPSLGSIDGISYARRVGSVLGGVSMGFQPNRSQQGISTNTRKLALYTQLTLHEPFEGSVTAAYARTYLKSELDREAVSVNLSTYSMSGFSLYASADIDLRKEIDSAFALDPTPSLLMVTANLQVTSFLSLGVGIDASRPVYEYSVARTIPDSLTDRTLRSGMTMSVSLSPGGGLGIYNNYSPRASGSSLGTEYSNYSGLYLANIFETGATLRFSMTRNANPVTKSEGYGTQASGNVFGLDCTLRYQRTRYTLLQLGETESGETFGVDAMLFLSRHLSFVASYDAARGMGMNGNTVFTELSWRF